MKRNLKSNFLSLLTLLLIVFSNVFPIPASGFLYAPSEMSLYSLGLPVTRFPIRSVYYNVDSNVRESTEPGFLRFHIHSSHAEYDIEGLAPFKKLLHEIEVIERIKNHGEGSGFAGGAVDSVVGTGKGLVQLVVHPVNSVKGIGQAAGEVGSGIGRIFRKKENGESTSFSEKMLGANERELANRFGVDVYTTNPYLKELLLQMAKARLGGKGAAFIGKLFVPGGIIVSAAIAAGGVNGLADQLVDDNNRPDLFRFNQEALLGMGFHDADVKALLNSPFFTPREATYMRFYLEKLHNVYGYRGIMKKAAKAQSLWEARKILYSAQIAADGLTEEVKFQKIVCYDEGVAIETRDSAVLITPYDYLNESELGENVLNLSQKLGKLWAKPAIEIWNGGIVSTEFSAIAIRKGIKTRRLLLF